MAIRTSSVLCNVSNDTRPWQREAEWDLPMERFPSAGTIGAQMAPCRRRWADFSPSSSWGNSMSIRDFFRFGAAAVRTVEKAEEKEWNEDDSVGRLLSRDQLRDNTGAEAAEASPPLESRLLMEDMHEKLPAKHVSGSTICSTNFVSDSCGVISEGISFMSSPTASIPATLSSKPLGTVGAQMAFGRRRWADISPSSSWGNSMSMRGFLRFGAAAVRAVDKAEEKEWDEDVPVDRLLSSDQNRDNIGAEEVEALPPLESCLLMKDTHEKLPSKLVSGSTVCSTDFASESCGLISEATSFVSSPTASMPATLSSEPLAPQWSAGSVLHASGQCKPCGFYWRSMGCKDGPLCQHCHLCTVAVKKAKRKARKQASRQATGYGNVISDSMLRARPGQ